MIKKWGVKLTKRSLLFFGLMMFASVANAQLNNAAVNSVSFTQEFVTNSLTSVTDTLDVMNVDVYIDGIDFMGEVLVTVYDQATGYPLQLVKQTKTELETNGLLVGSVATLKIFELMPSQGTYNVDVQVRNVQGGNLPLISTQY